jgi:hypothetical protein
MYDYMSIFKLEPNDKIINYYNTIEDGSGEPYSTIIGKNNVYMSWNSVYINKKIYKQMIKKYINK